MNNKEFELNLMQETITVKRNKRVSNILQAIRERNEYNTHSFINDTMINEAQIHEHLQNIPPNFLRCATFSH